MSAAAWNRSLSLTITLVLLLLLLLLVFVLVEVLIFVEEEAEDANIDSEVLLLCPRTAQRFLPIDKANTKIDLTWMKQKIQYI